MTKSPQLPIERLTISCDICACHSSFFIYDRAQEQVLEDTLRAYGWRIELTQFGSLEHCPDCVVDMAKTRTLVSRDKVGRLVEYLTFDDVADNGLTVNEKTLNEYTEQYL